MTIINCYEAIARSMREDPEASAAMVLSFTLIVPVKS
jgi:hypothetical protein